MRRLLSGDFPLNFHHPGLVVITYRLVENEVTQTPLSRAAAFVFLFVNLWKCLVANMALDSSHPMTTADMPGLNFHAGGVSEESDNDWLHPRIRHSGSHVAILVSVVI